MLDILHNGVTKKVNASQEETDGLLIVSGIARWVLNSETNKYEGILIDSRITDDHEVQSVRVEHGSYADPAAVITGTSRGNGYVKFESSSRVNGVIVCTMYKIDETKVMNNLSFGFEKSFENVTANFTDWNLEADTGAIGDPFHRGTVVVEITDDSAKQYLNDVVPDSMHMSCDEGNVNINEVTENYGNGRFKANASVYIGQEHPEPPAAVTDGELEYIYHGRNDIEATLPEVTIDNWIWEEDSSAERHGETFYEAVLDLTVPEGMSISDVIYITDNEGHVFPTDHSGTADMFCYGYGNEYHVLWYTTVEPTSRKFTAKVLLANYGSEVSGGQIPVEP